MKTRQQCPTCEGLGVILVEYDNKPANVTCPQCKGNEFIMAELLPDEKWTAPEVILCCLPIVAVIAGIYFALHCGCV